MDAKRKRMLAAVGAVALAAGVLAVDQTMSLGLVDSGIAQVMSLMGDSPPPEADASGAAGSGASQGGRKGLAAKASAADEEGDESDEGDEGDEGEAEDGEEEEGDGGKIAPVVKSDGPEASERVHTALATLASWEPKPGAYPEGALLGYLMHRKLWVSAAALAFAVESGAYGEDFLRARGQDIRTRFHAYKIKQFLRRYEATKPTVFAKVSGLVGVAQ